MSNVYHWNQTPPLGPKAPRQPEIAAPRRMTIPELMLLRELLEAYREEWLEQGVTGVPHTILCLLRTLNEDIRDNNR